MRDAVRRLGRPDMAAAAAVHRTSFDAALPWLAGRHTPAEDLAFFSGVAFDRCEAWGAFDGAALTGFIALRGTVVEHLYVLPARQSRGVGGALLTLTKARRAELTLWTFQRNAAARRFYERRGFVAVEFTDGADNEEREPDVRYLWRAGVGTDAE